MLLRIIKFLLQTAAVLVAAVLMILLLPALWHRWISYPSLEKQRIEFLTLRKATPAITSLNTYRGIMHAHSFWSHDSEGTLGDLIPAARKTGIDFIFLTDHPRDNADTIPRGYRGLYEGVLIEPGSEKEGSAVWPLDSMIIDWQTDKDTIARNIAENGGMVFYAHTEEPHSWGNPYYQGMEIYNFHADVKDELLLPAIVNLLVNGRKYPGWAYRQVFDEQGAILALWDSLNTGRKIVGSSAADTHENQNIRARYLSDGRVEWMGPNADIIDTTRVNFMNRWLFDEPDSNGWIFRLMTDTYQAGFNHVTNYILADTLSLSSLGAHIRKGHLYTAFKFLGDASGFMYYCENQNGSIGGIMGDSISFDSLKTFRAVSPFPGRFRLIRNGKPVNVSAADDYSWYWGEMIERGAYRLEVYTRLKNRYVPWVYTNPIYVY